MKIILDIRTKYHFGRPPLPSVTRGNLVSLELLTRRTVTLKNHNSCRITRSLDCQRYNGFDENHGRSNGETRRRRSAISSANHVNIWLVFSLFHFFFSLFHCFYRNTVRPSDAQHNKIPRTSGPMNILRARNFHRSICPVSLFFPTRIEVMFGHGEITNISVHRSYLRSICDWKHWGYGKTLYVGLTNKENGRRGSGLKWARMLFRTIAGTVHLACSRSERLWFNRFVEKTDAQNVIIWKSYTTDARVSRRFPRSVSARCS